MLSLTLKLTHLSLLKKTMTLNRQIFIHCDFHINETLKSRRGEKKTLISLLFFWDKFVFLIK